MKNITKDSIVCCTQKIGENADCLQVGLSYWVDEGSYIINGNEYIVIRDPFGKTNYVRAECFDVELNEEGKMPYYGDDNFDEDVFYKCN